MPQVKPENNLDYDGCVRDLMELDDFIVELNQKTYGSNKELGAVLTELRRIWGRHHGPSEGRP